MCGRYTITVSLEELTTYYELGQTVNAPYHQPRYNIAPTQQVLAVIHDGQQNRLGQLRWGLIPNWAKDEKIGVQMINARAETLSEKPSFKQAFSRQRCILVADSYYEWQPTNVGKLPMRIKLKDREIFSFAGLYDTWITPDGRKISSCTIITAEATGWLAKIHHRVPVILPREAEQAWLNRHTTDSKQLTHFLNPYPVEQMIAYHVSKKVGNIRNDDETCILPVHIEGLT